MQKQICPKPCTCISIKQLHLMLEENHGEGAFSKHQEAVTTVLEKLGIYVFDPCEPNSVEIPCTSAQNYTEGIGNGGSEEKVEPNIDYMASLLWLTPEVESLFKSCFELEYAKKGRSRTDEAYSRYQQFIGLILTVFTNSLLMTPCHVQNITVAEYLTKIEVEVDGQKMHVIKHEEGKHTYLLPLTDSEYDKLFKYYTSMRFFKPTDYKTSDKLFNQYQSGEAFQGIQKVQALFTQKHGLEAGSSSLRKYVAKLLEEPENVCEDKPSIIRYLENMKARGQPKCSYDIDDEQKAAEDRVNLIKYIKSTMMAQPPKEKKCREQASVTLNTQKQPLENKEFASLIKKFPIETDTPITFREVKDFLKVAQNEAKVHERKWRYSYSRHHCQRWVQDHLRRKPDVQDIESFRSQYKIIGDFDVKRIQALWQVQKSQEPTPRSQKYKRWSEMGDAELKEAIKKQDWPLIAQINLPSPLERGVAAARHIKAHMLLCDYNGKLVEPPLAKDFPKQASAEVLAYLYSFTHNEKHYSVDGHEENGTIGRLFNHSIKHPNVRAHVKEIYGSPCIILAASRDIEAGEQLLFDYGDRGPDLPDWWNVCLCKQCEHASTVPNTLTEKIDEITISDSDAEEPASTDQLQKATDTVQEATVTASSDSNATEASRYIAATGPTELHHEHTLEVEEVLDVEVMQQNMKEVAQAKETEIGVIPESELDSDASSPVTVIPMPGTNSAVPSTTSKELSPSPPLPPLPSFPSLTDSLGVENPTELTTHSLPCTSYGAEEDTDTLHSSESREKDGDDAGEKAAVNSNMPKESPILAKKGRKQTKPKRKKKVVSEITFGIPLSRERIEVPEPIDDKQRKMMLDIFQAFPPSKKPLDEHNSTHKKKLKKITDHCPREWHTWALLCYSTVMGYIRGKNAFDTFCEPIIRKQKKAKKTGLHSKSPVKQKEPQLEDWLNSIWEESKSKKK